MTRVGSRELKNRLGAYLAKVERGETILVTDRGRPIAKITRCEEDTCVEKLQHLLRQAQADGHLQLAAGPIRKAKPATTKGKLASRIILEERE